MSEHSDIGTVPLPLSIAIATVELAESVATENGDPIVSHDLDLTLRFVYAIGYLGGVARRRS